MWGFDALGETLPGFYASEADVQLQFSSKEASSLKYLLMSGAIGALPGDFVLQTSLNDTVAAKK
tara:strand:- start:123 stop:314 length:192 start_codon:yes stop_codon:yes gene_type:complete